MEVREQAAMAFGRIGGNAALQALEARLHQERDYSLQVEIQWALKQARAAS